MPKQSLKFTDRNVLRSFRNGNKGNGKRRKMNTLVENSFLRYKHRLTVYIWETCKLPLLFSLNGLPVNSVIKSCEHCEH